MYSSKLCVGFSIKNKKLLKRIEDLNIKYVLIEEKGILANNLKERIELKVESKGRDFDLIPNSEKILEEFIETKKTNKDFEIFNYFIDIVENLEDISSNDIYLKLYNLNKKYFCK